MPRRKLVFDPTGATKSGYQYTTTVPAVRKPIRLYPNQKQVALESAELLKKYGFYINTSETGAGKTLTTIATAIHLGVSFIVFGPPSASKAWNDSCAKYATTNYLGFISIDTLKNGGVLDAIGGALINKVTIPSQTGKSVSTEYSATPYWEAICEKGILMIFDEAHNVKNKSQRNAAMAPLIKTLSRFPQSYYALLSATLLDKSDSAMNFASMMGMVSSSLWLSKVGGVDNFDTVYEFVHYCLKMFDFVNKSNRTTNVIINTSELIDVKYGHQIIQQPIRKYYNGGSQARYAAADEGGDYDYDQSIGNFVVPTEVDPAKQGRKIPLAVITKGNFRDFVADLFFDVIMEFTGVEIENVNIARMAYRGFFEVNPEKADAMKTAIGVFKDAAGKIINRNAGKSLSGAETTQLDFGAVNVAIMHIEELMADTYIKLTVERMRDPFVTLPDGRIQYKRVVIALNYHSSLENVKNALIHYGFGPHMLVYHGKIPAEERDNIIDQWNDEDVNNPYRIFLMTAATGGMSISLHDTVGTRYTVLYYSPDYQMIKAHQTVGRVFRHGQKSIGEAYLVYPKLADNQIDNIMLSLARKSSYILRTRRYKVINSLLQAEGTPETNVNFPGTYPRYIQGVGYIDEHRIDLGCKSGEIPAGDCEAIKDNIVKYVELKGQYAYTHIPVPPPIKEEDEPTVDVAPENVQFDRDIYKEDFVPGFVYLYGSPGLISNWGNITNVDGKWIFTGVSNSGINMVNPASLPFFMQPPTNPMAFLSSFATPTTPTFTPWNPTPTTPTTPTSTPWNPTPTTPTTPTFTPWNPTPSGPSSVPWNPTPTPSVPSWNPTPTTPTVVPSWNPTPTTPTVVPSWNPTPTPTPTSTPWNPTPTPTSTPTPTPWNPTPTPTPTSTPWNPTPSASTFVTPWNPTAVPVENLLGGLNISAPSSLNLPESFTKL